MVANELAPCSVHGGLGIAVGRLSAQLKARGVECRVVWPARGTHLPARIAYLARRAAAVCRSGERSFVVCHDNEGAPALAWLRSRGHEPLVFWLHSLYDFLRADELPRWLSRRMASPSLIASAIVAADLVVTSAGVLADAQECEWPPLLDAARTALLAAHEEGRVLNVESLGCLEPDAALPEDIGEPPVPGPYVLFPSRPVPAKGLPFFAAVAARLRDTGLTFVALGDPEEQVRARCPDVRFLGWQTSQGFQRLARAARAVAVPSVTEGYGLAAAEAVQAGASVVAQEVGGHRSLAGLPGVRLVSLAPAERATLYRLWGELLGERERQWEIWDRYAGELDELVARWAEAVKAAASAPREPPSTLVPGAESSWGARVLARLRP